MPDLRGAGEATRPGTTPRQVGQSLVEYALIIVLVAALLLVALVALQDQIGAVLTLIREGLDNGS